MKQESPKQQQCCTELGPGGGNRDTPLEPGMALIELLYFFLLGCIVHLPLHTIPHLRQRVLIHWEVPATLPYILGDLTCYATQPWTRVTGKSLQQPHMFSRLMMLCNTNLDFWLMIHARVQVQCKKGRPEILSLPKKQGEGKH